MASFDRHHRELQHLIRCHRAQPDHTGGRLFGAADDVWEQVAPFLVDCAHQIRAIIHGNMRGVVKCGAQVLVVVLSSSPLIA